MKFKVGDRVIYNFNKKDLNYSEIFKGCIGTIYEIRDTTNYPYRIKWSKLNKLHPEIRNADSAYYSNFKENELIDLKNQLFDEFMKKELS